MPFRSANLELPYLAAAQAQKHVTHNEALELLDAIVQLTVVAFNAIAPPASAEDGEVWALGAGASGAWAGQGGKLALWSNGGWLFVTPRPGWRAASGTEFRIFDGTGWGPPVLPDLHMLPGLGIGMNYDAVNVLAVEGEAALFTGGDGGHQLKINKATPGDTAALLLQTGWSGRAEIGTAGSDDLSIKVSPDGMDWHEALLADHTSGAVVLPNGLSVGGALSLPAASLELAGSAFAGQLPLGRGGTGASTAAGARGNLGLGSAATADTTTSAIDPAEGRAAVVRASGGMFGLGGLSAPDCANLDDNALRTGIYRTNDTVTTAGSWPPSNPTGFGRAGILQVLRLDGGSLQQVWLSLGEDAVWRRRFTSSTWGPWRRMTRIVGAVSQAGGVATGAIVERGSNANGEWLRLADGTQIVTRSGLQPEAPDIADGAMFRSSSFSLTLAAVFAAPPLLLAGQVSDADIWLTPVSATTSTASFRARCASSKGSSGVTAAFTAIGRWF